MSSKCRIYVFLPQGILKTISISPQCKIGWLSSLLPQDSKYTFYYNGNELDNSKTIKEENVCQEAFLVALKQSQITEEAVNKSWSRFTEKHLYLTEDMKRIGNPQYQYELCRLNDLRAIRTFNRLKSFPSKILMKKQAIDAICIEHPDPVFSDPLTEPSTEALPCFW